MGEKETMCLHIGAHNPMMNGAMAAGVFAWEMSKHGFEIHISDIRKGFRVYACYWVNMGLFDNHFTEKWDFLNVGQFSFDDLESLIDSIVEKAKERGALVS